MCPENASASNSKEISQTNAHYFAFEQWRLSSGRKKKEKKKKKSIKENEPLTNCLFKRGEKEKEKKRKGN